MFTSKKNETTAAPASAAAAPPSRPGNPRPGQQQPAPRPEKTSVPSVLSNDLFVSGNVKSDSDIKIEGRVEGDLVARLIQIGAKATVKGKISADEVVIDGNVKGKVRGIRVRLNSGARVEGDIIHETIAIEAGAHFEGTVKRQDNPLADQSVSGNAPAAQQPRKTAPAAPQPPRPGQAKASSA